MAQRRGRDAAMRAPRLSSGFQATGARQQDMSPASGQSAAAAVAFPTSHVTWIDLNFEKAPRHGCNSPRLIGPAAPLVPLCEWAGATDGERLRWVMVQCLPQLSSPFGGSHCGVDHSLSVQGLGLRRRGSAMVMALPCFETSEWLQLPLPACQCQQSRSAWPINLINPDKDGHQSYLSRSLT